MHTETRTVAETGTRILLQADDGNTALGTVTEPLVNALTEDRQLVIEGAAELDAGGTCRRFGKSYWTGPDGETLVAISTWTPDIPDPEELLGDRMQRATRHQQVRQSTYCANPDGKITGQELALARLAYKTIRDAPEMIAETRTYLQAAHRSLNRLRRETAEQRYITGADDTLHSDAHLPVDAPATVAMPDRITALAGPGEPLVVTAPTDRARQWVTEFIRLMCPLPWLTIDGAAQIGVEATAEARRFTTQSSDLRLVTVYATEDWEDWGPHSEGTPVVITAADLLAPVEGVPDWAHSLLRYGPEQ